MAKKSSDELNKGETPNTKNNNRIDSSPKYADKPPINNSAKYNKNDTLPTSPV